MTLTLGVDIGAGHLRAAVVDEGGRVRAEQRRPIDDLITTVAELVADVGGQHALTGLGVALPTAPSGEPGPLAKRLQTGTGLPTIVETAARCATWAEHCFGAAADSSHAVLVDVGDALAGGMVLANRLRRGHAGRAAEFGHLRAVPGGRRCPCGQRGCWQQYAGGRALVLGAYEYAAAGPGQQPTAEQVLLAAEAGDPAARSVRGDVLRWLGHGLARLATVLDPQVFVLAGLFARASADVLAGVTAAYTEHLTAAGFSTPAQVRSGTLGPDATVVGAAVLAAGG